jgi:hypothetical protein
LAAVVFFQHGDLLAEGEDFEGGIASTAKEDSDRHKEREDDLEHESIRLTRHHAASLADDAKSQVTDFKSSWAFLHRHRFNLR